MVKPKHFVGILIKNRTQPLKMWGTIQQRIPSSLPSTTYHFLFSYLRTLFSNHSNAYTRGKFTYLLERLFVQKKVFQECDDPQTSVLSTFQKAEDETCFFSKKGPVNFGAKTQTEQGPRWSRYKTGELLPNSGFFKVLAVGTYCQERPYYLMNDEV